MDVRRKIKKLFVGFHWNSAESALEKMPPFFIFCIEIFRVSILETLEIKRDALVSFFLHEKMKMVGHYRKDVELYPSHCYYFFECICREVKH